VNAIGYQLLGANEHQRAIAVLRLNALTFPGSANVHDSLTEAYERAGQRELAIAAYRRALALDPRMASARQGLARLGVAR
jgi:Flp pilus assembly protein TadD